MTTVISGDTGIDKVQDGVIVPADLAQPLTSGTAVASTSGTSIDFTGIPSWVKRITVMLDGVSTNGASVVQIQIGDSGGVETSGYVGYSGAIAGTNICSFSALSAGFSLDTAGTVSSTGARSGIISLTLLSAAANLWACSGNIGSVAGGFIAVGGSKPLSATLDRVRITTVNGTDTFDAGTINIMYE